MKKPKKCKCDAAPIYMQGARSEHDWEYILQAAREGIIVYLQYGKPPDPHCGTPGHPPCP